MSQEQGSLSMSVRAKSGALLGAGIGASLVGAIELEAAANAGFGTMKLLKAGILSIGGFEASRIGVALGKTVGLERAELMPAVVIGGLASGTVVGAMLGAGVRVSVAVAVSVGAAAGAFGAVVGTENKVKQD